MKALILSGGKGTRLKPLTTTVTKQLIPVANRPILFYAIDQIRESGIDDIGIIISPETGDHVREAVGDGSKWKAKITYILQPEPAGLAHAVKTAQEFLGDSAFIMHLGDTLIEIELSPLLTYFHESGADALIILHEITDPKIFQKVGVVQLDKRGEVVSLEEKPHTPHGRHGLVGVYFFSSAVHEAISRIEPSERGELEITDAIQELINMGKRVKGHTFSGWWLDTGKKDDLLEANRVVLDRFLKRSIDGKVDEKSSISGRVGVGKGSLVENSTIRGPVSIAENCQVKDSFIGPFTSIGKGSLIEASSIEYSVILQNCHIYCIERLTDSLIGNGVQLTKRDQSFKAIRLFVGDDAIIEV